MGIFRDSASWLMKEALRRPFGGELLTLGVQTIWFTPGTLFELADQLRFPLAPSAPMRLSENPGFAAKGFISDVSFFSRLGFSRVSRTDYSPYEGAEILMDLNAASIPSDTAERFDVIVDGGTIEHVFDLPQVFRNLHQMLKPEGRIVHLAPSSNHVDHGFFMFSPTLFHDYYSANGYEISQFQVYRHTKQIESEPLWFMDYAPGRLDSVSYGGLGSGGDLFGVACVVTKRPGATAGRVPQQSVYRTLARTSSDPGRLVEEIHAALRGGDVAAALRACAVLQEKFPNDAGVWRLQAAALKLAGDRSGAVRALDAANAFQETAETLAELARLHSQLGNVAAAEEALARLRTRFPDEARAFVAK